MVDQKCPVMEMTMSDVSFIQLSALAKAVMFPVLYVAFFAWSYALLP
jgi:hypothetical protein